MNTGWVTVTHGYYSDLTVYLLTLVATFYCVGLQVVGLPDCAACRDRYCWTLRHVRITPSCLRWFLV